jgi:hypothetical protein
MMRIKRFKHGESVVKDEDVDMKYHSLAHNDADSNEEKINVIFAR